MEQVLRGRQRHRGKKRSLRVLDLLESLQTSLMSAVAPNQPQVESCTVSEFRDFQGSKPKVESRFAKPAARDNLAGPF